MSNLGLMLRVFLLSSFLAAATTDVPTFINHNKTNTPNNFTNVHGIECDSCQFITHKIDDYVFHNEKFFSYLENEFDNICNLLPDDAKNICYTTINNTLPSIIGNIGDYIAAKGCQEIGICPPLSIT